MNTHIFKDNRISYEVVKRDINNGKHYFLAYDNDDKGSKRYLRFTDKDKFIFAIDLLDNIQQERKVGYEILPKIVKPYFDIDIKDEEIKITRQIFNEYLDNVFLQRFNEFFDCEFDIKDFHIYLRENEDNIIRSIHIINSHFSITQEDNKKFVDFLRFHTKQKQDKLISNSFDLRIYTQQRLFNLPYHTKKNKNNPFIPYQEQDNNPKKYLISITDTLQQKDNKKSLLLFEKEKELKEKKNKKLLSQIFSHIQKSQDEKANKEPKEKITKQPKTETIKIYKPIDLFDYIIINLPKEFFNNSRDWKQITRILKKNMTEKQFNEWNEISIQKSLKSYWTKEKNEEFFKSIDIDLVKSGNNIFSLIIEEYIPIKLEYIKNSNELFEWLEHKTGKMKNELENILNGYNDGKKEYQFNEYVYNTFTGFLYSNKKVVGNYFFEIEYIKLYQDNKLKNINTETNDILQAKNEIISFMYNQTKIFLLSAKWGSGKTQICMIEAIRIQLKKNQRTIIITENNALNRQHKEICLSNFPSVLIQSHINKKIDNEFNIIICSLESIQKICFKETDLIIMDEYESLFNHFESDTFDNSTKLKFLHLKQGLILSNKIIGLDADISNQRTELLKTLINQTPYIVYCKTNNFQNTKFNIFLKMDIWKFQMDNDIKDNQKIIIGCSTKAKADNIYQKLKALTKRVLKIDSDGAITNFQEIQPTKSEVLMKLEHYVNENNIDILIFTPTIKTGISINNPYFDKGYFYGNKNSVCVREFIQMLFRQRNIQSINIVFEDKFIRPKPYLSDKIFKSQLIREPSYLLYTYNNIIEKKNIYSIDQLAEQFLIDKDFFTNKVINNQEKYYSQSQYIQEFIIKMVYNHNIQLNYINTIEDYEKEEKKEEEADITTNEFVETKLLNRNEYLQRKADNTFKELTYIERRKNEFFYLNYFISGISNSETLNEDIYNEINDMNYYDNYIKGLKMEYENINKIINNKIEINLDLSEQLDFNKIEQKEFIFAYYIIHLLEIDIETLPLTLTNKEYETKLFLNKTFQDNMKELIKLIHKEEDKIDKQIKELNILKNFKSFIKDILRKELNINISYKEHHHTHRPSDKMIFDFIHFKAKRPNEYFYFKNQELIKYPKIRFTQDDIDLKKIKKAVYYIHNEKQIKLYKQKNGTYLTYEWEEIKLRKRKTDFDITKSKKIINELRIELKQYYRLILKPKIFKGIKEHNTIEIMKLAKINQVNQEYTEEGDKWDD